MFKPPFSRDIFGQPRSPNSDRKANNDEAPDSTSTSLYKSISYIPPVAIRAGPTLALTKFNLATFYSSELQTPRLNTIASYLWLAGLPSCARALHRQVLLCREIVITEDPNEHLVWHENRVFVKPFPSFLFQVACWEQRLCKDSQLYEAACSFILSYAWLVRHESDLRLAHEKGLLPDLVTWQLWTAFLGDVLEHIDLNSLSCISPRFQYGELRLSRLDKIYRLTRFKWDDIVRGYMTASTWYKDFFSRHFAWVLAVFAVFEVCLNAMQVVASLEKGGAAFGSASYGFAIASLFMAAATAGIVTSIWGLLVVYHLANAFENNRRVMEKRRSC